MWSNSLILPEENSHTKAVRLHGAEDREPGLDLQLAVFFLHLVSSISNCCIDLTLLLTFSTTGNPASPHPEMALCFLSYGPLRMFHVSRGTKFKGLRKH